MGKGFGCTETVCNHDDIVRPEKTPSLQWNFASWSCDIISLLNTCHDMFIQGQFPADFYKQRLFTDSQSHGHIQLITDLYAECVVSSFVLFK